VRYFLIDRIQRLEHNRHVTATKNVTISEDVFAGHFPSAPVMPGALLIESLVQAGTALLEVSANHQRTATLIAVREAKFRSEVRPGDQLSVEMNVVSLATDTARMEGTIRVNDRLVASANLVFALKDASELSRGRPSLETAYDVWLKGAELVGF
jgi:3-hydroxyacyl-[acyl-carrier-protein] dehydratase